MKDLFDKLSDSVKNTYKEAVGQTQNTVDQTKYRKDMIALKSDLKKLYMQLGKECYREQIQGNTFYVNTPLCNRITALREEIATLDKQLAEVVEKQKDSFEAYKRDVRKTWDERQDTQGGYQRADGFEVMKFCSKCNVGNNPKATHCTNCGSPF
ncbi:MAG: hypothetical protein ACRCW2_01175 [Cellulosilyticaceae bacterium]